MVDQYEKLLYKLASKAFKKGEIPVAALVVMNGKIISKAYNRRNAKYNPLYHAEVQAIVKAARKLKNWRLSECELYTTLKPCHMCEEIILESRINRVYYFIDNSKIINYKTEFNLLDNSFSVRYKELLTSFFKNLR